MSIPKIDREAVGEALRRAQVAQRAYWDSLLTLEQALGGLQLSSLDIDEVEPIDEYLQADDLIKKAAALRRMEEQKEDPQ